MNLLYRCTPCLLGLVFLFSGTYKILHPSSAILALRALDIPNPIGSGVILVVTLLELYLGILLIARVSLRYAIIASSSLLLGFSFFLFYLSLLAHPPACGCMT